MTLILLVDDKLKSCTESPLNLKTLSFPSSNRSIWRALSTKAFRFIVDTKILKVLIYLGEFVKLFYLISFCIHCIPFEENKDHQVMIQTGLYSLASRRKAWKRPSSTPRGSTPASCRIFPRWSLGWRASSSRWGAGWPPSVSATISFSTLRWGWRERLLLTAVCWSARREGERETKGEES